MFVEGLPRRLSEGVIPYAFVLPGLFFVALMLIYPTFQTINYSFANADSTAYVGLQNYKTIFGDPEFWQSIVNNVLWLLIVPAVVVAFGVIVAVLADKLSATRREGRQEPRSSCRWRSRSSAPRRSGGSSTPTTTPARPRPACSTPSGSGSAASRRRGSQIETAKLNSILLMVILIWLQVGFSMVLLSSAIKGVPEDTIEAARIDGASELQIFWQGRSSRRSGARSSRSS